jgi:hypothetical protein
VLAGLRTAFLAAAVVMLAGTISVRRFGLHEQDDTDGGPVGGWAEPHLMLQPHLDEGPVLITASYRVPEANQAAFVAAMQPVRRSRLRTGATRWGLFRDGGDPGRFVEVYQMPTWEEYLRQHETRRTGTDEQDERNAVALTDGPATVTRLLPGDSLD